MNTIEKKLDAICRHLTAENGNDQRQALKDLRELMAGEAKTAPITDRDMEAEIRRMLLELGVPDHIKGHRYLIHALRRVVREPELTDAITKGLYPTVAKAFDTTASRVERAIRHAIETAWDRGDLEVTARYFGNTVSFDKGKPTNSEFIARIANELRQRV